VQKPVKIVAAVVVACASAAVGWYGVKWWQAGQVVAAPATVTATPSPSTTPIATIHLTFDLEALTAAVQPLIEQPQCGDTFTGTATPANGITPVADASLRTVDGVDEIDINAGYKTASNDPLAFLATEGNYIVTRNGVVVSPDWGTDYIPQYFVAQAGTITPTSDGVMLTGSTLCDVADQLNAIWQHIDFATAKPEEIAQAQKLADAFNTAHAKLPPGEYKIYAWSPIVVGEPAAIARALTEEGINDIGTLAYTIGNSPLADDPRLTPYCTNQTDDAGAVIGRSCDVPPVVLKEVIARDVPVSYVVGGAPALAISEPTIVTIP
jgi:hypothetical protein